LASTAKRLPAKDCLPIVQSLLHHKEDEQDPHMPLLLWWAVERHAVAEMDMVMEIFGTEEAWRSPSSPIVRETVERLMRRYAAEGSVAAFAACARLLTSAPTGNDKSRMLADLDQGLQDRPGTGNGQDFGSLLANYATVQRQNHNPRQMHKLPAVLEKQLDELWNDKTIDVTLIRLMARLGKAAAQSRAVTLAVDSNAPLPTRLAMLQTIEEVGAPEAIEPLLSIVKPGAPETLQVAALRALQHFDLELIADRVLQNYSQFNERVRSIARKVLLSRKGWALKFLRKIDQGKVAAQEVPVDQVRQVSLFQDDQLDQLVRKHWGNIQPGTPEEKLATIRRFMNDLRAGKGNPVRGRVLFAKQCGNCHQFFGEGTPIGPDLTHANRKDRDFLLVSIVDPSAVIRKEYLSYVVHTKDGRVLTGLLADPSAHSIQALPGGHGLRHSVSGVTLLDGKNERTTIKQDQVESIQASPVSLMPENTLQDLQPQELRDLFSYLASDQPPAHKNADP
jgi:putative heme-binding domain-containing protein